MNSITLVRWMMLLLNLAIILYQLLQHRITTKTRKFCNSCRNLYGKETQLFDKNSSSVNDILQQKYKGVDIINIEDSVKRILFIKKTTQPNSTKKTTTKEDPTLQ